MTKPITEEKEMTLQIEGRGQTKEQALNAAFSNLKNEVGGTPLRIEPLDAEVLEADEIQYTERFLFLFFRRTRFEYFMRLRVRVRVVCIKMESISFKQKINKSIFR
ncbi:DUF4312 family protein [Lacrimispora sp.]|uniref:DUF4312 family protein n=1 Tax=Lacrimispora sp. TaxID=2719234 RepID=UPI0028B227FA|nr:DUF4312 family protein [Lacrimispora sp.]